MVLYVCYLQGKKLIRQEPIFKAFLYPFLSEKYILCLDVSFQCNPTPKSLNHPNPATEQNAQQLTAPTRKWAVRAFLKSISLFIFCAILKFSTIKCPTVG
jgi:hypothetical protein